MNPFNIRPDEAVKELADFNRKLADGVKTLSGLGEISEGVSPHETVYTEDKLKLVRYTPRVEKPFPVPVLVVYALVNRPYMADLQEDRSMIRGLLDQGLDVYLIDWGYPDGADRFLTLDDYVNGYVDNCVDMIRERSGHEKINLLGICQGGAFSLCYSSLHPEKVRNLVTMVTPVDFHDPDFLLSKWVREMDVDQMVDTMGNIPGDFLNFAFVSMKPYALTGQKYLDLVSIMGDERKLGNFMRMEKWIFDSPDQAGEAFRQFAKEFFQKNGLLNGDVVLGDRRVDLKNVTMPVFNVFATKDHVVPPAASRKLGEVVGSDDYEELAFRGGHIGIYTSGRSQKEVPPKVAAWIKRRCD